MKIRSGFVSNSSTSSFIIAVDKEKLIDPFIIKVEFNLSDFVQETLKTPQEVEDYIESKSKITARQATLLRNEVKKGKVILMGDIDCEGLRDSNPQVARIIDNGILNDLLNLETNVLFYGRES